jgi:hypothetical protein
VDKAALGQVFSEYFKSTRHSGAGAVGQMVADVPVDLVSPHPKTLKAVKLVEKGNDSLRGPVRQVMTIFSFLY